MYLLSCREKPRLPRAPSTGIKKSASAAASWASIPLSCSIPTGWCSAYHINCADHFQGVYTSNELPHFIRDMTYDYDGNPALGHDCRRSGEARVRAKAHNIPSEYAWCVPAAYEQRALQSGLISAFCTFTTSPTAAGWAKPSSAPLKI
jgi:hypothetical protein